MESHASASSSSKKMKEMANPNQTATTVVANQNQTATTVVANQNQTDTILPNLPDELVETIISFMPIKEAVSNGLIAKRFLNTWKSCRDLSFDCEFRSIPRSAEVFSTIKRLMDEHSGPEIQRLKLLLNPNDDDVDLVLDWIKKATTKGVQELDLDFITGTCLPVEFTPGFPYGAPLQILKMNYCDVESIENFEGLRYLKTLAVHGVFVPRDFTIQIFNNCLLLENFEIKNCNSEYHLVIDAKNLRNFKILKVVNFQNLANMHVEAPSLQGFYFSGEICRVTLKGEMDNLDEAVLHFTPSRGHYQFPGAEDLMNTIKFAKRFSVNYPILERLCPRYTSGSGYKGFHFGFLQLREIHLLLGVTSSNPKLSTLLNPYDIICLLNHCPHLERLYIDFGLYAIEPGYMWQFYIKEHFAQLSAEFKYLKTLHIMNFKFFEQEMEMVKFIIKNAKLLESCSIVKVKSRMGPRSQQSKFLSWLGVNFPGTNVCDYRKYKPAAAPSWYQISC